MSIANFSSAGTLLCPQPSFASEASKATPDSFGFAVASTSLTTTRPLVSHAMSDYIFTTNDSGKDVVTHEGTRVGHVKRIDGENRATVERTDDDDDGGLTEKIKDMLGWSDNESEDDQLQSEHVDKSEDDRLYLRRY
jgi:hypothetical protein